MPKIDDLFFTTLNISIPFLSPEDNKEYVYNTCL